MTRLRIAVESIVSDGFDLELPHAEGEGSDRVVLSRVVRLHGTYEHDARQIRLRRVAADALGVGQLAWHWPGGRVVLPGHADVEAPVLDLVIAREARRGGRALSGTITATRATLGDVGLELPGARVACELSVTGLEVREPPDASPARTTIAELRARGVHASAGDVPLTAGEIDASHVRVVREGTRVAVAVGRLRGHGLRVRAGDLHLAAASFAAADVTLERDGDALAVELGATELREVELEVAGARVRLEHLVLPAGGRFAGGELTVPALRLDTAQVAVRLPPATATPPSRSSGSRRKRRGADLRFLDRLSGRVDVDATVDARVPFLKRRQATHRFRVPIDDGTIDFKRLEGDLSLLEDALIDFEVRRGKLVLEVKPPLLRFAKKTLVDWPLSDGELALAEQSRVHLRTLAAPRVHAAEDPEAQGDGGPGAFELTRLDLDPIAADLRLDGPVEIDALGGTIHLGTARDAAIGALSVRGALHHHARGASGPTEIALVAERVRLAADRIHVGGWEASVDVAALAGLDDGAVTLDGARPTAARAVVRGLALRSLRLAPLSPASRRRR